MTNYDDVDRRELISIFVDGTGQAHLHLVRALLSLTPDRVETTFIPDNHLDLPALRAKVRGLAEGQAADIFSGTQLIHTERLAAEREKMERYYRQQELAVIQIAIDNVRQAKQRELLTHRHADLVALDHCFTLVPDLMLVGIVIVFRVETET